MGTGSLGCICRHQYINLLTSEQNTYIIDALLLTSHHSTAEASFVCSTPPFLLMRHVYTTISPNNVSCDMT
jgi:hypothetical protein